MLKKYLLQTVSLVAILIIAIVVARGKNDIECVLDSEQGKLLLYSNNAIIQEVTLKYNTGIVQYEKTENSFRICNKGTEYVRVDYMNEASVRKYVTFEIIISDADLLQISVSRYNMMGIQEEHHAY